MTAVRDTLCNMDPVQIPRPQISGLQFIPTRGRLGFYKSIRRDGEKYGVGMQPIGPRRPVLSDDLFQSQNADSQSAPNTPLEGQQQQQDSNPSGLQMARTTSEPPTPSPDYGTSGSTKKM